MPASRRPVPKIAAVGVSGAASTVLIAIANAAGLDLSPEMSAAIVLLATFGAGYIKRGA